MSRWQGDIRLQSIRARASAACISLMLEKFFLDIIGGTELAVRDRDWTEEQLVRA